MTTAQANSILAVRSLGTQTFGPYTVTANTAVVLPSSANMLGNIYTVINSSSSTANILIEAADGTLIRTVYPGTTGQVTPNTDAPTTSTMWEGVGTVTSNWITATGATVNGTTTNPVGATIASKWRRNGGTVDILFDISVASPTSGSGEYVLALPTSPVALAIDYNQFASPSQNQTFPGFMTTVSGSGPTSNQPMCINSSGYVNCIRWVAYNGAAWSQSNNAWSTGRIEASISCLPIVGWTATKG